MGNKIPLPVEIENSPEYTVGHGHNARLEQSALHGSD
jgi:hypothetical protein